MRLTTRPRFKLGGHGCYRPNVVHACSPAPPKLGRAIRPAFGKPARTHSRWKMSLWLTPVCLVNNEYENTIGA
jgi:hypothetical protein